ncbi:MAG: family 20 glycosylhydrolase [Firmicutes bacterium]|nr:family 20 glycosylhydrolase [Bacillota bacterium]
MGASGGRVRLEGFTEASPFRMLGIMVDVSRNGVLRPEAVQRLLRLVALMGINTCMLYTEDTYELPGEPFFGYLRGRYAEETLRALDAYAAALGIEMIPCIQTLGHLEQILKWPRFWDYRDTPSVLIAEEPRTYALVGRMIAAASRPFRTRRIHVGMDEAWGIGTGRYRERHGQRRPFDILNAHLARVREICRRRGLRPMIWSDMYFRLGSKQHEYYDRESVIPEDVRRSIPGDVDLVYWDYYHVTSDFYEEWIDRHRELGAEPIMAGGVWTWNRLWATLPFSFTATEACMRACKRKGLREAFVTMWGDDGMECDVFSALPGIQLFAEHGYTAAETVDPALLRANFRGACGPGAELDDWVRASAVDAPPGVHDPATSRANPSKWLLWQDPLLAVMDPLVEGRPLAAHYERLATELAEAAERAEVAWREAMGEHPASGEHALSAGHPASGGRVATGRRATGEDRDVEPLGRRLLLPARLAQVLALKSELRRRLAAAYRQGDRAALRRMADVELPALRAAVDRLWRTHRAMWMATYEPFGWEVVERRYGGLMARLATVAETLEAYLDGRVSRIPELEAELLPPVEVDPGTLPEMTYARVATPSAIK